MKISLTKDGGFAAIPALSKPIHLDTNALSASQATELGRLLENISASVSKGSLTSFRSSLGRDILTYCLSIDEGGICTRIQFDEMTKDAGLQSIRRFLEMLQMG